MMRSMRWLWLSLLLLGLAGCNDNGPTKMDWSYMVGSNADEIWHTRALFSREGVRTHESSNGTVSAVSERLLKEKSYRWFVGKGRSFYGQPVPDKVEIEWVSYHDKKRYGITLDLPKDLGKQMAQRYRLKGDRIAQYLICRRDSDHAMATELAESICAFWQARGDKAEHAKWLKVYQGHQQQTT